MDRRDGDPGNVTGFFAMLLRGLVRDAVRLVLGFAIGTGAAAVACWWYGLPLVLSLAGGFAVLGVVLALMSASLF